MLLQPKTKIETTKTSVALNSFRREVLCGKEK